MSVSDKSQMLSIRQQLAKYTPSFIIRIKNRIHFWGKRYQCPLCLSNLRLFFPLPDKFRVDLNINGRQYSIHDYETFNVDQYSCPVCYSTDRDRLYALYFNRFVEGSGHNEILIHFAPEKPLSIFIRKHKNYIYRTSDLFMEDVDDHFDITELNGYQTESVDCFICSHILEHVPHDAKALTELYRILRPTGWGIIMAPIIPSLDKTYEDFSITTDQGRLMHFGQEDHVRVYAKNGFIIKLQDAGFLVTQLGENDFGKDSFLQCGITRKSVLYIVSK